MPKTIPPGGIVIFPDSPVMTTQHRRTLRQQLWKHAKGSRRRRKAIVAALLRGDRAQIARFLGDAFELKVETVRLKRAEQ